MQGGGPTCSAFTRSSKSVRHALNESVGEALLAMPAHTIDEVIAPYRSTQPLRWRGNSSLFPSLLPASARSIGRACVWMVDERYVPAETRTVTTTKRGGLHAPQA